MMTQAEAVTGCWEGQGITARQTAAALGCRARRRRQCELQGTLAANWDEGRDYSGSFRARWEGENMKWYVGKLSSPVFISTAW